MSDTSPPVADTEVERAVQRIEQGDQASDTSPVQRRPQRGAVNAGFVQVSKMYIAEMNQLAKHAPTAHTLLWMLVQEMNKQNSVMISVPSMAKILGMSPATVKRAISLLREQQWLEVLKIGTGNVYRVNSSVFWQDRADGKWASFDARVVVNWDEQDDTTRLNPPVKTRHIPLVEADDSDPEYRQRNERQEAPQIRKPDQQLGLLDDE